MNNTATFEANIQKAAARMGCDLSSLKVISVTIDRTWGDLCGYAFIGPEPLVERAAQYCLRFHSSVRRPGSYGAQNSAMDRGVRAVYVDVKTLQSHGIETKYQQGQEPITARVVSTVYYPCAE